MYQRSIYDALWQTKTSGRTGGGLTGNLKIPHHDLFNQLTSIENLFEGWTKFCRGKLRKHDVLVFERCLEENLFDLQKELRSLSYRHADYIPFKLSDPKPREIHKACVRDRVVHQAIVNILEPIIDRTFVFDSFSCRKTKGTHAAVSRLRLFLQRASKNNTRTVYVLKCDIRRFFATVDHAVLLGCLDRFGFDNKTQLLIGHIIDSFHVSRDKGLPLGNLTSQLFANVYLNELDRFVKFTLREQFYVRYCDDFILVSPDKKHLYRILLKVDRYLSEVLLLKLHPKKVSLRTWANGIDFCGYVLMPHCMVLRTRTRKRLLDRICAKNAASYFGLLKHANTFELQQQVTNFLSS